jgi:uncharacterized membrane protein YiaA
MKKFLSTITLPWFVYVMYFLGVGFISGSIVHFPIDPRFYSIIAAVGIIIFLFGAVMEKKLKEKEDGVAKTSFTSWVFLIISSLILSIGIGMLSGGIQHFTDIAEEAKIFIPLGLALSIIGFVLKNKSATSLPEWKFVAVKVLALIIPIYFVTSYLAHSVQAHEGLPSDHHAGETGHHE